MFEWILKKCFPERWRQTASYRRDEAQKYDNKILKYVTERRETGDVVVAKDSYICVKAGFVYVNSETESLFKCDWEQVDCGELMSHDGVIFTGFDQITERERSIICYFKYYR